MSQGTENPETVKINIIPKSRETTKEEGPGPKNYPIVGKESINKITNDMLKNDDSIMNHFNDIIKDLNIVIYLVPNLKDLREYQGYLEKINTTCQLDININKFDTFFEMNDFLSTNNIDKTINLLKEYMDTQFKKIDKLKKKFEKIIPNENNLMFHPDIITAEYLLNVLRFIKNRHLIIKLRNLFIMIERAYYFLLPANIYEKSVSNINTNQMVMMTNMVRNIQIKNGYEYIFDGKHLLCDIEILKIIENISKIIKNLVNIESSKDSIEIISFGSLENLLKNIIVFFDNIKQGKISEEKETLEIFCNYIYFCEFSHKVAKYLMVKMIKFNTKEIEQTDIRKIISEKLAEKTINDTILNTFKQKLIPNIALYGNNYVTLFDDKYILPFLINNETLYSIDNIENIDVGLNNYLLYIEKYQQKMNGEICNFLNKHFKYNNNIEKINFNKMIAAFSLLLYDAFENTIILHEELLEKIL